MAAGLFMIAVPDPRLFKLGLATIIVGNGMFKPNISTMVGKLYPRGDERRDSGFTIFYMGINAGAFLAPILTGWLAQVGLRHATPRRPTSSSSSRRASACWSAWCGSTSAARSSRASARRSRRPRARKRVLYVALGALVAIPVVYFLLALGGQRLQYVLTALFIVLAVMLMMEGIREGKVARDKVIAMMIIFTFNILFWMFFEQAGSSFTFLADQIVNRNLGGFVFPTAWFQSVNSVAIIVLAPVMAWIWIKLGKANPSIPRKFGLGLMFNGLAFLLLMFALSSLVGADGKIPFWTLVAVYVIQSVGELCLSPIGLSMVTKLAPVRLVGFGMGGWFLSTGIGNNLSGIFASAVSGEGGMTTASALSGYTFGFWALLVAGVVLFLAAPLSTS